MRWNNKQAGVSRAGRCVLAGGLGVLLAGTAQAALVGPGFGIPNDANDSSGGRINVDESAPLALAAGTYVATTFQFDAGIAGDVTPFVAFRPDPANDDRYQVLAVGTAQTITGAAQDQTLPFGGTATFTLATPTTVYVGIASNTQNPIALDNDTAAPLLTDHEGGGQAASSYIIPAPGPAGIVPPDGQFSNPDLGRRYAFGVDVQLVPEPSSAAVIGLLALGLCGVRRRRQQTS